MTEPRLVDSLTKKHLILLLCKAVEDRKPDYASMLRYVRTFQDMLETRYGCTLGYEFTDPSIHDVWSEEFQRDFERYDALAGLVDDKDDILSISGRPIGMFLLGTNVRNNLNRQFGDMDKLTEEIRLYVG